MLFRSRPDSMCQRIVKLAIDLQEDVAKKQFRKKYESVVKAMEVEGENSAYTKGLMYLLFYFLFGYHPKPEVVHSGIEGINYKQLLALFTNIIKTEHRYYTADSFVSQIKDAITDEEVEIDAFYYYVLDRGNLAPTTLRKPADTPHKRAFFLTLLHVIMLQDPHKTFEGTFSERLLND